MFSEEISGGIGRKQTVSGEKEVKFWKKESFLKERGGKGQRMERAERIFGV